MSHFKRQVRFGPITIAVVALLGLAAGAARADAIQDLQAQVQALQKRGG